MLSEGDPFPSEGRLIIDHASVPDAVRRPDGDTWVYFVNARPGQHGIWIARQNEAGQFDIIDCVRLDGSFEPNAVDPDVVPLPDGRFRLYYYLGQFVGPRPPLGASEPAHPIYAAVSDDGINFRVEGKALEVDGVTDPSVARLADGTWLMALSQGQQTLLGASSDGVTFALTGVTSTAGGVPELAVRSDGLIRLLVSAGGITSLISRDNGATWTAEPGTRVVGGPGKIVADPSVVAVGDGAWELFYKVANAAFPPPSGPGGGLPQPPQFPIQPTGPGQPPMTPAIPPFLPESPQPGAFPPPGGQGFPPPGQPVGESKVIPASSASEAWRTVRVGGEPAPGAVERHYADADVIPITGGYRMYVQDFASRAIVSFRSPDGLAWTLEPGSRISGGAFPDALTLPDGRVRIYYQDRGAIVSSISTDGGLTFAAEPGTRIDAGWHGEADRDNVAASTTIRLPDGRYRMYYRAGVEDRSYFNGLKSVILSATSDDGLTWTAEEGVRVDSADWVRTGTPENTRYLDGPDAVLLPDGAVKLYFWGVGVCDGVCLSTSADGLTFDRVEEVFRTSDTPFNGNPGDPAILPRADAAWLMYFGNGPHGGDQGIWIAERAG